MGAEASALVFGEDNTEVHHTEGGSHASSAMIHSGRRTLAPQDGAAEVSEPEAGASARESFGVESADAAANQAASCRLVLGVIVACFSPLLFGFSLCFTSPAQASMEGTAKGGRARIYPLASLDVFMPAQFTMYAALFNLGALFGAFAGSAAMERLGRKRALLLSSVAHAVAWFGTALASDPALLILLRALAGVGVGMGSSAAPCYIGEVSTVGLHRVVGAACQLSFSLGVFVANVVGAYVTVVEVGGETFCDWRRLAFLGVAFAGVLATILALPESPKWLARHGHVQAANVALRRLRRGDTSAEEAELAAYAAAAAEPEESPRQDVEVASSSSASSGRVYRLSDCKRSLFIMVGVIVFQQFSGINAIMMFTAGIFAQAGAEDVELCTTVVMLVQLAFTAVSSVLVEKAGRRCLLLFAGATMCLSHIGMSYYYVAQVHSLWGPSWLVLLFLCTYIVGFSSGMGPIPWIILAEVFPEELVGCASRIATTVGWLSSFVVCATFRDLQAVLGPDAALLLFAICCLLGFGFVSAWVPATKGRSVEEVLWLLRGPARSAAALARRRGEEPKTLRA